MPLFMTIVEDTSPVLLYSGSWRSGSSSGDDQADRYTKSSSTITDVAGSSMSFRFYGTSVTIVGAKRFNHGNYQVQVDGQSFPTSSGLSSAALFNQTLFTTSTTLGFHEATITNLDNKFLDIDYVVYTTSVGEENEPLIVNMFKDSHPSFVYLPQTSWGLPDASGSFVGGCGHATRDPAANATFNFQHDDCLGNAIALYGPVGPTSSEYAVSLDGGAPMPFNAVKQFYRPQQLLFYAANLSSTTHTIRIIPGSSRGSLAIDYATVYTASSLGGSFGTPVIESSDQPSQNGVVNATMKSAGWSRGFAPGVIAGLTITSIIALLSTAALAYLFLLYRRERQRTEALMNRDLTQPYPFAMSYTTSPSFALTHSLTQISSPGLATTIATSVPDTSRTDSNRRHSVQSGYPVSYSANTNSDIYERPPSKRRIDSSRAMFTNQLPPLPSDECPSNEGTRPHGVAQASDELVRRSGSRPSSEIRPPAY
ncbi:hypothetical protein NLJ89_g3410 [Agrocybe chaxingu]|uniref:Uncharacterized protein n=1 Tax=Agrocybe chaxingu TaxID=84603 RepID=A0A9W8MWX0_9AGAR|nr:hypothetical protein NLJ89_g3410 [Agrocybe chaxingu]